MQKLHYKQNVTSSIQIAEFLNTVTVVFLKPLFVIDLSWRAVLGCVHRRPDNPFITTARFAYLDESTREKTVWKIVPLV